MTGIGGVGGTGTKAFKSMIFNPFKVLTYNLVPSELATPGPAVPIDAIVKIEAV
jgi:hypothetical protein